MGQEFQPNPHVFKQDLFDIVIYDLLKVSLDQKC